MFVASTTGRTAVAGSPRGRVAYRQKDAERKRAQSIARREVVIPPCADRARRERLEANDEKWLMWYFAPESGTESPFTYEFTEQQRAMIAANRHAILFGGDQANGASRGEGKTTLMERQFLKAELEGTIDFSVLFAATGTKADDSLNSIKTELETNERLAADYPEVCIPVRALGGVPQLAHSQLVTGLRHDNGKPYKLVPSRFRWCGQEIYLPNVPGSPSAGFIFATRGLDAEVRGLKKKGKRPKVAGIDDPDTEETVRSEEQARKLEERIDRGIGGLGGQKRAIARVMAVTLQRHDCVSAWYTDPKIKPSFKGRRYRYLLTPPVRADLWDDYVNRWQSDKQRVDEDGNNLDEFSRGAHQFYLDNREAMDEGAVVANPNRFDPTILPDGSQLEVSALQSYYNFVAKNGIDAARAELDNDPPEEAGPVESGITATRIQKQVSGYEHRVVPPACIVLTAGIDIGKRLLHWVVRAWRSDATGYTIDYGRYETFGTTYAKTEGEDTAVYRAVLGLVEYLRAIEYETIEGTVCPIGMILVDAGWQTSAVKSACKACGLGIYPVMGFGKSSGCTQANFSPAQKKTTNCKPGDGWKIVRKSGVWLVEADADAWKRWEHNRWMTDPGKPGAMYLYGQASDRPDMLTAEQKEHIGYAKHVTNEVEVEDVLQNRRYFRERAGSGGNTHYGDASYYSDVGASIKGIRLLRPTQSQASKSSQKPRKKVGYL